MDATAKTTLPAITALTLTLLSPGSAAAQFTDRWEGEERTFEREGETWCARPSGAGAYGTGARGQARLVAVHFFRGEEPDTPVREALVAAGAFPHLRPEELRALCDRATPIDLDRGS